MQTYFWIFHAKLLACTKTNQAVERIYTEKQKGEQNLVSFIETFRLFHRTYENHVTNKDIQRQSYNDDIKNVKDDQMVIVMDFKESIRLRLSSRQTSRMFYHQQQVSCLGFICYYEGEKGKIIQKKYQLYLWMLEP